MCIDEPQIRDRILKSTILQIRQVPCIISDDKKVYEGELAFRFVNSIIDANAPPAPVNNNNTTPNTTPNTTSNTTSNNNEGPKGYTSIEDIPEDTQEEITEESKSDSYQDRYSKMHVSSGSELKSKSKKIANKAAEMEKERNSLNEPPPSDRTSMRVTSLNDVGLDLSKGRQENPIKSVKTGAPINVNKLMSAIESRS